MTDSQSQSSQTITVSVICTVLDEGAAIRPLLDSLLAQTRPPDEVVIVDGGSSDDTVAQIEAYADRLPLRVLVVPGANISTGRNRAIEAATGDVIASTDAGVRLDPHWLEKLIAPFENDPRVAAVAGFFLPDPRSPFEVALGATVLPLHGDVEPDRFLPSSRSVAFTRAAWEAVGGYPEWLDYCEDLIFDLRLRDVTGGFAWAPEAVAYFRPRPSLHAFFRQYYRYARGDGKADLWRLRHAIRYSTYLVAVPALLGHALWGRWMRWLGWLGLVAGGLAYCWRPFQRLRQLWGPLAWSQRLYATALIPLIRVTGDVAKMLGYPAGWLWRLRYRRV